MVDYDPQIVRKFADRMYRQAQSALVSAIVLGAFIGGGFGFGLGIATEHQTWGIIGGLIGAVVLGALGYVVGQERAFQLKLQAQSALCQLRLEENTHK